MAVSGVDVDYGFASVPGNVRGAISGESPGIVTIDNVPGRALIDLFRRSDRALIRMQLSADNGTYKFRGLPLGIEHDLIARDLHGEWDDIIVGRVLPYAPPQITTAALSFVVGTPATTQMAVQYGGAPFAWSADVLPAGLTLSASGLWGGTPTASGTTTVVVTCTDTFGEVATRTYTVTVT